MTLSQSVRYSVLALDERGLYVRAFLFNSFRIIILNCNLAIEYHNKIKIYFKKYILIIICF